MGALQQARRVVVVDDSRTIQVILDNAFSRRPDFQVVGFAADATTAAEMVRRLMPDIVTIDLCMPYLDGEALLAILRDLDRVCKVIVSDKSVTSSLLHSRLMAAGASLCIAKRELADSPNSFFRKINDAVKAVSAIAKSDPGSSGGFVADLRGGSADIRSGTVLSFPIPTDEKKRLDLARRKHLFNADAEAQFDAVTKHVARSTAFPVALLTFIDRETQWVKSAYGINVASTPRDQAFCNYTISQGGTFAVANATADPRFRDNPLVVGVPNIRSYTGHPVVTDDGTTIGALCVIDTRVRAATKHTLDELAGMAEIVARMIDLRPLRAA